MIQKIKIKMNKIESNRINNAYKLYEEIKDLFEDSKKRVYLLTILTKDEIDSMIEEFITCFSIKGDKDKILIINNWKNIVNAQDS